MKRILSISLLICMCFQCVLKLGIVAWYQANKKYVATTLCENRDKPQMKCCGKCYLRKQLNKTEGSGNQQNKSSQSDWIEFLPVNSITMHFYHPVNITLYHQQYKAMIGYDPLTSIFHPPPVA